MKRKPQRIFPVASIGITVEMEGEIEDVFRSFIAKVKKTSVITIPSRPIVKEDNRKITINITDSVVTGGIHIG